VIALCIVLAISLIAVSLAPQSPFNHAPSIARNHNGQNGGDEATEYWTIFGRRLKITDTLLVLFTFTLWWANQRLVGGSEETAERQLRAYIFGAPVVLNVEIDQAGKPTNITMRYEAKNWGQTPAYRIRNAAYVAKLPWPLPRDFVVQSPKWDDPRTIALGPGQSTFQQDTIPYEVLPKDQRFYLVALIEYFDAFGNKRTTKLCASGDVDKFLRNATGHSGGDDVVFEI
jgi:hypothetical protein